MPVLKSSKPSNQRFQKSKNYKKTSEKFAKKPFSKKKSFPKKISSEPKKDTPNHPLSQKDQKNSVIQKSQKGIRIAKVIADSGYCSRREAEELIFENRVQVNGNFIESPALLITDQSIKIDGKLLGKKQQLRLFLFHKPAGYICTNSDPEGRPTIFSLIPKNLPRLIAVGRLDFNSEGLLLLATRGEVSRYIELPKNAWIRKYRVRVFGKLNHQRLENLSRGIRIDNVSYGAIQVKIDKEKESNSWLEVSLTEGKNREIRKIMAELGLTVNRLIRIGFGPFNLAKIPAGAIVEIKKGAISSSLPQELLS